MASLKRPTDKLTEVIGVIGKWQYSNIAICFLIGIPGLAHIYSAAFIAAKVDFWCADDFPGADYETAKAAGNITFNNDACNKSCNHYQHDTSFWKNTIITEFDLYCDNAYLSTIAKMTFFTGFGCGTFGAGLISDMFGRKSAIVLMSQLLFGCGILTATMPNYITFVLLWFFTGIAAIGVFTVCFVWAMESVSGRWKTFVGMTMNYAWPIGRLTIPFVAWITRDWKTILQVVSALHIVTPLLMNYVPESPRWLLSSSNKAKREQAREILEHAAKQNGNWNETTEQKLNSLVEGSSDQKNEDKIESLRFTDLFRYSVIRRRALVMYVNWFANSFILYGLALNWQSLTGGLFINFIIGAALDFPAKTLAMFLLIKTGRRWPYIICMGCGGVAFFMMAAFERGKYDNDWPIVTMAMIGNLFVSTTFAIIWLYTPELFPTSIRNASLGSCSLVARIGGVLANTVSDLATIHVNLPIILFGATALLSSTLSFLLPETAGKPLANTIAECELYDSKTRGMTQISAASEMNNGKESNNEVKA